MLSADDTVLAILSALPKKKIAGKKRLQKTAYLLKTAGAQLDVDFELWHYGVFSKKLANAANDLALFDVIEEIEAPVGPHGIHLSEYRLRANPSETKPLSKSIEALLEKLDNYSTVDLEVASTVLYFESIGLSRTKAWEETEEMKPNKVIEPIVRRAEEILEIVSDAQRSANKRSGP